MKKLSVLLLICICFIPSLTYAQTHTVTHEEIHAIVNSIEKAQEVLSIPSGYSITKLQQEGFDYEPHLVVPANIDLQCKSQEEREAIIGMRTLDWHYALFFNQGDVQGMRLYPYTGKVHVELPTLSAHDWATIKADPHSAKSHNILLTQYKTFRKNLVMAAYQDNGALQSFAARRYGYLMQELYITTILLLSVDEGKGIEDLLRNKTKPFQRKNTVFTGLLNNSHLQKNLFLQEKFPVIEEIFTLLEKHNGYPSQQELQEIEKIVEEERDALLAPCP